ncbi:PHP domain-containing protein [Cohnella herbarum]|uniref:Histidinol-phosphatase n=1 Tax=Cohnella herbarum TaxID=2728023 RepID=A0A7Z2VP00_9BACL|nr:PHP domain-containing protein [Cohnella herbarum]QJD86536.1 histidinol phosphate phosphatase domain-containing protein [Cohnella herbarum]
MKVDMHFHLEEGPYSLRWLSRTMQALIATDASASSRNGAGHTLDWAEELSSKLDLRMQQGCFSEEWLDRYLVTGRSRGISAFGVVDHLYRFRECRSYYEKHMLLDDSPIGRLQEAWLDQVCVASLDEFVAFIAKAKKTRPDLLLGIEADFFEGGEEELGRLLAGVDWDHVIGSVHFIDGWGFDNPETQSRFEDLSPMETYGRYFGLLRQACRSGLFDIIAHPDNLKVFGFRPAIEKELLPYYREMAEEMVLAGVATEINTGLAYRYPVAEACPSPLFLSVLAERDVPITLSSDSHFPDDIGMLLDEARTLAIGAGYKELTVFEGRRARGIPIGK